jgi:hypothetical protein
MAYLQREKIRFILRLRENQFVLREGYAAMPISGRVGSWRGPGFE